MDTDHQLRHIIHTVNNRMFGTRALLSQLRPAMDMSQNAHLGFQTHLEDSIQLCSKHDVAFSFEFTGHKCLLSVHLQGDQH